MTISQPLVSVKPRGEQDWSPTIAGRIAADSSHFGLQYRHALASVDECSHLQDTNHGGNAILAGHDRPVGHEIANLYLQAQGVAIGGRADQAYISYEMWQRQGVCPCLPFTQRLNKV